MVRGTLLLSCTEDFPFLCQFTFYHAGGTYDTASLSSFSCRVHIKLFCFFNCYYYYYLEIGSVGKLLEEMNLMWEMLV